MYELIADGIGYGIIDGLVKYLSTCFESYANFFAGNKIVPELKPRLESLFKINLKMLNQLIYLLQMIS